MEGQYFLVLLFWVVTKTIRSVILSDGNCDTNPWNSLGFSLSAGTLRGHLCFITLPSLGLLSESDPLVRVSHNSCIVTGMWLFSVLTSVQTLYIFFNLLCYFCEDGTSY